MDNYFYQTLIKYNKGIYIHVDLGLFLRCSKDIEKIIDYWSNVWGLQNDLKVTKDIENLRYILEFSYGDSSSSDPIERDFLFQGINHRNGLSEFLIGGINTRNVTIQGIKYGFTISPITYDPVIPKETCKYCGSENLDTFHVHKQPGEIKVCLDCKKVQNL